MATRPLPEAAESRYAPYIAELREFFATSGIPFGSPDNVFAVADRMQEPGTFSDDLGSLIRSIILREGGAVPHAQLLEILCLAIAGPELAGAPQQYREPLRQLLAFLSGVMRRPWNVPPSESAEVVPFPTDTSTRSSEPTPLAPRVAVFERIRGEQLRERPVDLPSRATAMPGPDQADTFAPKAMPTEALERAGSSRRITPLQRNLLVGAGITAVLAALLTIWLRPHTPAEVFHVGPAPTQAAAASAIASNSEPVSQAGTGLPPATIRTKPSASGQPASPQLNRRLQTAGPQGAARSYSPSSGTPPTSDLAYVAPETREAPAAPIIRRPAYRNPESSIAGDLPTGPIRSTSSATTPYFTVSSGVMAAYLIFSPSPQYPVLARLAHIQGQVILQAVVGKDGSVSTVRVLRGNRLLRGAAANAVRRWRYRPYRLSGKPIDVATIITVDFHDRN